MRPAVGSRRSWPAGLVAWARRDTRSAISRMHEALAIHRKSGNPNGIVACLVNLVQLVLKTGDITTARIHLAECLCLAPRATPYTVTHVLDAASSYAVAEVRAAQGGRPAQKHLHYAARLRAAAEAWHRDTGSPRPLFDGEEEGEAVATLKQALGEDAFNAAWEEGRAMKLEDALALAISEGPA